MRPGDFEGNIILDLSAIKEFSFKAPKLSNLLNGFISAVDICLLLILSFIKLKDLLSGSNLFLSSLSFNFFRM